MHPWTMKSALLSCGAAMALIFTLFIPSSARAQVAGATVTGNVTDAQGAAVPNAKVTAVNSATNVSTATTANGVGAYTIPNLNPGDYQVSAEASGFNKAVSKVSLTVGAKQEMNFALQVGQVTQTVEVTGAAPQVELASSTISGVVESTQIVELPLNGRDWASLAQLQPGVVYEFLRNSALDGAEYFENFFGLGKGQFRRNQFGGAGGGPVIKNKIFVFGDYEGLRQTQAIPQTAHILTANARLGIINDNNGNPLPALTGA